MNKPTIYIVVQEGLVQDVYVKAPWAADVEVVICDLDAQDNDVIAENEALEKLARETAHHVY